MSTSQAILIYTVTYRVDETSPEEEEVCFTKERAEGFAAGICEAGGEASITEDCKNVSITPLLDPESPEETVVGQQAEDTGIVWPEKEGKNG